MANETNDTSVELTDEMLEGISGGGEWKDDGMWHYNGGRSSLRQQPVLQPDGMYKMMNRDGTQFGPDRRLTPGQAALIKT